MYGFKDTNAWGRFYSDLILEPPKKFRICDNLKVLDSWLRATYVWRKPLNGIDTEYRRWY